MAVLLPFCVLHNTVKANHGSPLISFLPFAMTGIYAKLEVSYFICLLQRELRMPVCADVREPPKCSQVRNAQVIPAEPNSTQSNVTCRKPEQALLRGARAVTATAASPSAPVLNAVTARAMLPAVALTFASLGTVKVCALL